MREEKKGMPTAIHGIETFGPSEDLKALQMEANDKLEELAKAIVNDIRLYYRLGEGWVIMVWYKILGAS